MGDRRIEGKIVVIAFNDADTIDDCLDGIADEADAHVEVVVVDLESADGSADVAIRHPRADRVRAIPPGGVDRVLEAAGDAQRIAILRADRRPAPGWLGAAFEALENVDVVVGPEREELNVAIRPWGVPPGGLFTGTQDLGEVLRRARLAGASTWRCHQMVLVPAAGSPVRGTGLPVTRPPASPCRWRGLISVVVCTRDRPQQLARCLDSLGRLQDDEHEIVVVDNHSSPTVTSDLLPPSARVVHEPQRGLDRARNRGIAAASGEVVAFIDDDCEADPHWLAGLRRSLADPAVALVTGRVRPASLSAPTHRYFESHFSFDRGRVRQRFTPWDQRPFYPLTTGPLGTGCNMAMRRAAVIELGGFDELLDVGSRIGGGGDLDMFARFLDAGLVAEYTPDALVWHHHRDDMDALTRQFKGYGEAVGALMLKAVLDRPGERRDAVRFYWYWLQRGAAEARAIRRGHRSLPMRLLLTDRRGALTGPIRYATARAGARVR